MIAQALRQASDRIRQQTVEKARPVCSRDPELAPRAAVDQSGCLDGGGVFTPHVSIVVHEGEPVYFAEGSVHLRLQCTEGTCCRSHRVLLHPLLPGLQAE